MYLGSLFFFYNDTRRTSHLAYKTTVSKASTMVLKTCGPAGYPRHSSLVQANFPAACSTRVHLIMCSNVGGANCPHMGHMSGTGGGHARRHRRCHHTWKPRCGRFALAIHTHGNGGCAGRPSSSLSLRAGKTTRSRYAFKRFFNATRLSRPLMSPTSGMPCFAIVRRTTYTHDPLAGAGCLATRVCSNASSSDRMD